jgi:hypothetical protein
MRIQRVRAAVAAVLAAAGVFVSTGSHGASLGVNLVVDPSFENVDTATSGPFTSVLLNDWESATGDNFAYPYASGYSGPTLPPGAGDYHFSGGFSALGLGVGHTHQTIDVAAGDTGSAIAAGTAQYNLSGYFSTYQTQVEFSKVEAIFLGAGGAVLGTAEVGGAEFGQTLPIVTVGTTDVRDWGQDVLTGLIPVGTEEVKIQLTADGDATNFDGYVDAVDFTVTQVPEPSTLALLASAGLAGFAFLRRRAR